MEDKFLIKYPKQGKDFISVIKKIVAEDYELTVDKMEEKCRDGNIKESRQVAMHLAKKMTRCSNRVIGEEIGKKDHATVIHANKTIINFCDTDREFKGRVLRLYMNLCSLLSKDLKDLFVCPDCGRQDLEAKKTVVLDINSLRVVNSEKTVSGDSAYCLFCKKDVNVINHFEYVELKNIEASEEMITVDRSKLKEHSSKESIEAVKKQIKITKGEIKPKMTLDEQLAYLEKELNL